MFDFLKEINIIFLTSKNYKIIQLVWILLIKKKNPGILDPLKELKVLKLSLTDEEGKLIACWDIKSALDYPTLAEFLELFNNWRANK